MALERWDFDTVHSSITFAVRHLVIATARGRFNKWTGSLGIDEQHPEASRLSVEIDPASIDTNEPQRDQHLRSADFFDVERFPQITFVTRRVEVGPAKTLRLVGDLTIRGVAREVVFDAAETGRITDPWGRDRRAFTAKTTINRKEFGVSFNQVLDTGGLALSDHVEVSVEAQAVKQVAVAAVA